MNCNECKYLMFDFVEGELSEPVRTEVEKHLEECEVCSERISKMRGRQQEEKWNGLFWYLLAPSGGFKRFFFFGAVFTFLLVLVLISTRFHNLL